eukprot:6094355-Pyramimonas_sp.AAC.1
MSRGRRLAPFVRSRPSLGMGSDLPRAPMLSRRGMGLVSVSYGRAGPDVLGGGARGARSSG